MKKSSQVVGLRELWTELEKKNSDNCSARVEVFWMWHYYGLPGAEESMWVKGTVPEDVSAMTGYLKVKRLSS